MLCSLPLCLHSLLYNLPGGFTVFHTCFVFFPPRKKSQNVYHALCAIIFFKNVKYLSPMVNWTLGHKY